MATVGGIFCPDYAGSQGAGLVGTIATTASTGVIQLGKYRVFKLTFGDNATATSTCRLLRFTLGISTGTTAPTPTAASPFLHNFHENFFELNGAYDQINLANLAVDGGSVTINYSILPLSKS